MKRDLDRLMEERGLDAILVAGEMRGNAALYYLANGAGVHSGFVLKKRGDEPVLFCYPMEREEAAASGLTVINVNKYDYRSLLREKKSRLDAEVELHRRIFADLGVGGRVGFYGLMDRGQAWTLLNALNERLEGVEVVGEYGQSLITAARATKDEAEVERIAEVGRRTVAVVEQTVAFLRSHRVKDETLVQADGSPLTVGRVHAEIRQFIAAQQLEAPEGFIFSIGREAGIPHSRGRADAPVVLGQPIIFDIYPCEAGGGYYFDMTRTFCLGYAPPEVERVYRDVRECVELLHKSYRLGEKARRYQQMTCEFFAQRGHPTVADEPQTEVGYVHSLGHGVGLSLHESPVFSDLPSNNEVLRAGHVFACEPGLYYPEQGIGVRIEDVLWMDEEGTVHVLSDFPRDLVIEL